ncbi:MAG: methylenetetrahydrofolate reductase C-terminal domain-containing protein [Synergistetes bacterium]|nr:methylenetetrahydrofolate reductase C-terminal domain-containing protein [Synergistota bacterium]MCX8127437.1 methylenetetrahydrofolate reductase C-terminal domain-containing protein [Synergistota bacterium]MDW8192301.1 methylenetetrahydrofolate reductase C-terminal domain-containing protein [Synergistota bacterium]
MIITKKKPIEEILNELDSYEKIFIVGCTLCATASKTGGEEEVREMKEKLEFSGKRVVGTVVLDPVCNLQKSKLDLKKYVSGISESEALLCMACGNGLQTLGEIVEDKPIFPANDTLFLGEVKRFGVFEERCLQCGKCLLTNGLAICPLSRCPKGMLNGPCGGAKDGLCEVNQDLKCVWMEIYERLKRMGRLSDLKKINLPLDYSIKIRPGQHYVRRGVLNEQT